MSEYGLSTTHRSWQDWALIALGVIAMASPWLTGQTSDSTATLISLVLGAVITLVGALEMVRLHRLEEVAQFACGLLLFVLPFAYGYVGTGPLGTSHLVLGAAVTLLAMLELWQDWGLTDPDMAHHGH